MAKSLVIVESPAKAKTIGKYLGKQYVVKASLGHIKDLPKKDLAVDVDNDFEPHYEVIEGKKKLISELKAAAKGVDSVYLAADPDREGEAICYHLQEELTAPAARSPRTAAAEMYRVMFNEITKNAIKKAFEKPGSVNLHLVEAQQARRILDRLVGYKISPLLWDKVRRGLSAGRVQTVALRLIVDREREIRAFQKREYWTIDVNLAAKKPPALSAHFTKRNDEALEIPNEETADNIVDAARRTRITSFNPSPRAKSAAIPFRRSSPPRCSRKPPAKLRFSVKRTMMLAQRLYEGVEVGKEEGSVGLITYMRTDSTRVSNDALDEVRGLIAERYGEAFRPETPNVYKSKKDAQDAHEAIRPTSVRRTPEEVAPYLQEDELKLYRLIWMRFVASQMTPAVFDQTTIDVAAKGKDGAKYLFRATGSVPKFKGFLEVYEEGKDQKDEEDEELKHRLPAVTEGEELKLKSIEPEQHFTEPPPRFNEATLVKELEADGVGRPSTYASILSTIQEREYVKKEGGKFTPTELGMVVTDLLLESFEDLFDVQLHGAHGRGAGRDRRRQDRLARRHGRVLRPVPEGSGARRAAHDRHQAHGEAHRLDLRQVRQAHGDQVGQARQLHRLHRLSRVHQHARADRRSAGRRQGRPDRAGRRRILRELRPSHGAEEGALRDVLRLLRLSRLQDHQADRRRRRRKPTFRWKRSVRSAATTWCMKNGRFGEFTACSNYPTCKFVKQKTIGVACPNCSEGEVVERRSKRGKTFYGCNRYPECDFVAWGKPLNEKCPECGSSYLIEKWLKAGPVAQCPNAECKHKHPIENPNAPQPDPEPAVAG